jgi:molybdopterin converting factor small subunit
MHRDFKTMNVRLLFFSLLRDITGFDEMTWTCSAGSNVSQLLEQIYQRWPRLGEWDSSLLIAVDQTYVKRDAPLHENCEVAIMPPVQGG